MFEYVKDAGLKFARPLTKRKKTDLIILHHVEGNMSAQAINDMHKGNGHKGIDYNIYVDKDGSVYWGRGLEYEGGHVNDSHGKTKGMNARSVGIVCNGNFMKEVMSDAQFNALCGVVADVVKYYGFESSTQVISHREAAGAGYTTCPGVNFPTDEVRSYIRNYGGVGEPDPPMLELVQGESTKVYEVKVGVLNFRSAPNGPVIKQLKKGDRVQLGSYDPQKSDWARVFSLPDKTQGYVWLNYIGPIKEG